MGANASHHEPLDALRGPSKPHSAGNVFSPYGRASLRKSLRRRKEKRKHKENHKDETIKDSGGNQVEGPSEAHVRKMDKLRKSFRESFKKKKESHIPEASKPHLWHTDEAGVKAGTCNFQVKYLGCVEVYESRGMQVCEEAIKVLRNSRRRPLRGVLYVSGDGLRVVDDDTKGLIVDQTIEKVSFCAPDRNHERGFSYICRDGTTRRWMCHGFIAVKETGERLSHAVGCAFAACLDRKQKRDKECGVTMTFDQNTSAFTRMGSFRQMTVTERLSDPQECKPIEPVPLKKVENPHAIARPHATPQLLQRQGSFRVFNHLNQSSPFKRQLSLRLNELPSNLERTRSMSLDNSSENATNLLNNNNTAIQSAEPLSSPTAVPPQSQRNRLQSLPNVMNMAPIPESSPVVEHKQDPVSAMCQQVSAGLSLLSSFTDPFSPPEQEQPAVPFRSSSASTSPFVGAKSPESPMDLFGSGSADSTPGLSKGEQWLAKLNAQPLPANNDKPKSPSPLIPKRAPPLAQLRSSSLGSSAAPQGTKAPFSTFSTNAGDPFDAEWVSLSSQNPNNPFLTNTVTKAFQVQM